MTSDVPGWQRLPVAPDQRAKLIQLRAVVLAANERLNLTRITDEPAFIEKHVLDSLLGIEGSPSDASWVDIGAGGGFPGLVIAIARPQARVLLVEAIHKKAAFLQEAARALGLSNVEVSSERAEDAARSRLDAFDRATNRAVGSVPLCLEYSLPFVKPGGEVVLYRGPEDREAEEEAARRVAPLLGGGEPRFVERTLPSGEKRRFIFVPKVAKTPAGFPRRTGVAAKRPL